MELLKETIEEIKSTDTMYLDKKEVLKRLTLIKKELNKRSELLSFLDWFKTKPELSEWNNDVILNLYKNDKKR
jgi:hypothetical protein